MIKYGIHNIRELFGPKINLHKVYTNPLCRLEKWCDSLSRKHFIGHYAFMCMNCSHCWLCLCLKNIIVRITVNLLMLTLLWCTLLCYIQTVGMCPLNFKLSNFSGHFRAAQTFDSMWLPTQFNIQAYRLSLFIAWNSQYFCVSSLNYFLLVLCPSLHQILAMLLIQTVAFTYATLWFLALLLC